MRYLFIMLFLSLTLGVNLSKGQKLNSTEEQIFKAEAVKVIEKYYAELPKALGILKDSVSVTVDNDEGEEITQKITRKQEFIEKYFDNNDIYVYNDLSPDDKEERVSQRVMTIDNYLNEIKRLYGETDLQKLDISLTSSQVDQVGYNSQAVEKFYYCKIKVERKLKGMYLGEHYTENKKMLTFFIKTLDKPDTRLKRFTIISIDYESQEINVGNIGVEAAIARGLNFYNEEQYDKAFQYLIKYSEDKKFKKNSNATWALGYMFFWGRGTQRSDEDMVKWLTYAADRNNLYAMYYLGENYWFGEYGVEEDEKKALKLIKKAARKGFSEAQFFMAERYANGEGVKQKKNTALRWYKKAEKQGHLKAKYARKKLEASK